MKHRFYLGDALEVLKTLPDQSVHCCVSSPPYWGLRDYGTATWEGGEESCDHVVAEIRTGFNLAESVVSVRGGAKKLKEIPKLQARAICPKCGAKRMDKQIGLESTPKEYVEQLVDV
ncbi:MAG: hypothetical protein MJA84_04675, partial [Firmicutes bacterium]|nr:hypothetical protein [Bacillota bacterium]